MNPQAIRDYSPALADAVTRVLGEGEFPVVLGGDCSILLGTMLALRRRGCYGLLYIDGDADFYQPEVNPLNGAASASDLAFATGYGPDILTDIEGRRPLVRADDVVVFACRDAADRERRACQPLPAGMLAIDRDQVRRLGTEAAAREAVEYLTRAGGPEDGFWIHVDADVLDETIMQAVDDPRPAAWPGMSCGRHWPRPPTRDAEKRLRDHPGVEVMCRRRGGPPTAAVSAPGLLPATWAVFTPPPELSGKPLGSVVSQCLDQLRLGHLGAALDADLPSPLDQVLLAPVVVGTALAAFAADLAT
jgi:hypothetical protein